MIDPQALGKRILARRKALKMNQADLAVDAKCDRSFIARVESGEKTPALETLIGLAEGLKVSVGYLLGEVALNGADQGVDHLEARQLLALWADLGTDERVMWLRMLAAAIKPEVTKQNNFG